MLKESRSLDRGLLVLETLAQHSALSLSEIHRATELPKSTLRRILATLVKRRFVRQSISDKLYRIAITLPDIASNPVPSGLTIMADISMKHVLDLTKNISWPSDIQVLGEHWLQVVETTRTVSPFSLYKVQIDLHVNLFGSATGTACLSQMDEEKVRALFERRDVSSMLRPSRFGLTWNTLQEHLDKVREQGFGERLSNFKGAIVVDDKLSAIAIPVRSDDEICGSISLLWPKSYMQPKEFAGLFLEEFGSTIGKIESDLTEFNRKQAATKKRSNLSSKT